MDAGAKSDPIPWTAITTATVGGAGFSPIAPGTVGSALGVGLAALTYVWPMWAKLLILAVITGAGVWASEVVGRRWGHDHRRIVIDEVAGQYLTLLVSTIDLFWVGFLLFRISDKVKPAPARYLDDRKGGFYAMADDLVAGLYALAGMAVLAWYRGEFS